MLVCGGLCRRKRSGKRYVPLHVDARTHLTGKAHDRVLGEASTAAPTRRAAASPFVGSLRGALGDLKRTWPLAPF